MPIIFDKTSLQARYDDLPARPTWLSGRFAPLGFALRARIRLALLAHVLRFALTKIFGKKKVCLDRLEMLGNAYECKKKFSPFDLLRATCVA